MTPRPSPLDQLLRLESSSSEFDDQVSSILSGDVYRRWVNRINGDDAVRLVEFLDRALDVLDPAGPGYRRCLRQLRSTCGERRTLPKSYTFPSQVLAVGDRPVASGGCGDVYQGTLDDLIVCVKRVRVYSIMGPEEDTKIFYQEAIMWKRLEHKNIVPLLGVTTTPLQLISEWILGGNVREYIGKYPNANRRDLACDIAEGLYYLHSRNVVHCNLKGPNILVGATGRARITDFGLAAVTQNLDSLLYTSGEPAHNHQWTAPEILIGEGSYSKEADVFSFAMVMIELFTGSIPFHGRPSFQAMVIILRGERPPRPTHKELTNDLWKIIQRCWQRDPHLRPEVSEILNVLGVTNPNATVNHVGLVVHESQRTEPYGVSREPSCVPSSWADHHHPGEQRGNSNGNALPIQGQNTEVSETSPVLKDPSAPGQMEPSQPFGRTGGAGKPRTNLQNADADAGSALNSGDGHNRGDTIRDSSRTDLLGKESRDHLGQPDHVTTDRSVLSTAQIPSHPNFDVSACKRLIAHDLSQTEVVPLMEEIFTSQGEISMASHLCGDDAQTFIDVIDKALDRADIPPRLRRKCLRALCKMCSHHALLPRSLKIPLCYDRSGTPLYNGGYADVWKGEHEGRQVAVKALRVYLKDDFEKITSGFCKEVVVWKRLLHPNVLPLLGVTMVNTPESPLFAMASEWMENGNINDFIRRRQDVNRFELLKDVAKGLIYMHSQDVIHGDLKGANIVIDQYFHACLADFGLATIASDSANPTTFGSSVKGGTTRWMSPELLDPEPFNIECSRPTKESDSYALGMVILEVLSGHPPFKQCKDTVVMLRVLEGGKPERPEGPEGEWFTDDLWEVLALCWESQRESRPSIAAILEFLEKISGAWNPPPPRMDQAVEMEEEDWDLTRASVSFRDSDPTTVRYGPGGVHADFSLSLLSESALPDLQPHLADYPEEGAPGGLTAKKASPTVLRHCPGEQSSEIALRDESVPRLTNGDPTDGAGWLVDAPGLRRGRSNPSTQPTLPDADDRSSAEGEDGGGLTIFDVHPQPDVPQEGAPGALMVMPASPTVPRHRLVEQSGEISLHDESVPRSTNGDLTDGARWLMGAPGPSLGRSKPSTQPTLPDADHQKGEDGGGLTILDVHPQPQNIGGANNKSGWWGWVCSVTRAVIHRCFNPCS